MVLLGLSHQVVPFTFCYCHPCKSWSKTMLSLELRLLGLAKQLFPPLKKRSLCRQGEREEALQCGLPTALGWREVGGMQLSTASASTAGHVFGISPKTCWPQGAANPPMQQCSEGDVPTASSLQVSPGAAYDQAMSSPEQRQEKNGQHTCHQQNPT